jgi:hypothetical protein
VIDNVVWTDSWPSIAGASCSLICVGADEDKRERSMTCGVEGHDRSLHTGFAAVHSKPSGYLVEPQNQDRRPSGRRRDLGAPRSFDAGGHVAGPHGLRLEDAVYGDCVAVQ